MLLLLLLLWQPVLTRILPKDRWWAAVPRYVAREAGRRVLRQRQQGRGWDPHQWLEGCWRRQQARGAGRPRGDQRAHSQPLPPGALR